MNKGISNSLSQSIGLLLSSKVIENVFWYAYLVCIIVMSFLNQKYDSEVWLTFSVIFYFFSGCYCLTVIFGARCHWQALKSSKFVLICLLLTILWLWLQTMISTKESILSLPLYQPITPAWFKPIYFLSINPDKTLWLMFSSIFILVWFLMSLSLLDSRNRVKQLLIVLLLVGSFHALVGISAMYSGVHLIDIKQLDGHYTAARGWFVNRNHYAAFLVITLIGSVVTILKSFVSSNEKLIQRSLIDKSLANKVFFLLGGLLLISAIILSQSRAGFIGILISLVLVVAIYRQLNTRTIAVNKYFVAVCILILLSLILSFGNDLILRFTSNTMSLGERVTQWGITWHAIKHSPVVGYGGGSYATVFQFFREYTDLRQVVFNQSHNDYLQLWLEQGLIGLLLWVAIIVMILRRAISSIIHANSRYVISVTLSAVIIIIAGLLQAGVDFNLQIINIRSYFFVIIALIFVMPTIHKNIKTHE